MSAVPADLRIENATIWTDGSALADADCLEVSGRSIRAVGARASLASGPPPRATIDARGATLTPGLWDAHLHLLPWARSRSEIQLEGAATCAEACERVRRYLERHAGSAPVIGRGWDATEWREPPERSALDAISADRPILLHSRDFHALWVNSAALAAARIETATPDPPGGAIERDAAGRPTGVLRENAVRPFRALEAEAARAAGEAPAQLAEAARALHALGVTAVHDFERGETAFAAMERFARGAGPRLRVSQCVGPENLEQVAALGLASGDGDDVFRVGPLKLFADGTLGSRTAAMLARFEDRDSLGLEVLTPTELAGLVARGLAARFSVAIHAIGDRACRNALDALERAGTARRAPRLGCRIEHAQLVDPSDLPRFAALGIVASMQPLHCTSDATTARRAWGSRIAHSYPWRELLDSGAILAFGSDAPVEPPSVAAALAAACTRQPSGGHATAFVPEQRIRLDEALRAYTEIPARLAGWWPRAGTLRAGSLADLVVWDRDLARTPPERLHEARPSCTVWDGAVVYGPQPGPA